mgnify:CR=1 FL=1
MTVSEAIIKWMKRFDASDFQKLKRIDTDMQSAEVDSYSLVKEPVQNVKSYLSGKKEYTDHYMMQARLSSVSNTERMENNGFGEALEKWVSQKNMERDFPVIPDADVKSISVTTPFYAGKTEADNIIYQMTVAIKYEKEK